MRSRKPRFRREVNRDPLRKVVDRGSVDAGFWTGDYTGVEVPAELLECGHIVRPKQDIYGETYAYRRRCRYCRQGKPAHT